MVSFLDLLPTLSAFIALILGILCLFAGTKTNMLPGVDIFTMYTPIGNNTGMHDYYSMHVMSYCEGFLQAGTKNLTGCSKHEMLSSFDPSDTFLEETGNTTSLSSLGWPRAITEDFHAFTVTSQSLGVFYCIGIGLAGLVVLGRIGFVIAKGPRQTVMEVSTLMLSFVMLSISSIVATVIAFQFVDLINYHGKDANVTAEYGEQFLGMTWAAVGLTLVGSIVSLAVVLIDRGRTGEGPPPPEPKSEVVMDDTESVRSKNDE